jgi:hypothetical protein
MAQVSGDIVVHLDAEATWAAATDWEGQRHWVLGSRVRPLRNDGREVGGTVVALTGYGPLTITDPMEITVWDPPRSVTLRHTGKLVTGTATYTVSAIGEHRSRVTWSEDLTAPLPALRGPYALGVPLFGLLIRSSLRRFARWAPTQA